LKEVSGGSTVPILQKYIPVKVRAEKNLVRELIYIEKEGTYDLGKDIVAAVSSGMEIDVSHCANANQQQN
jgi:hypothetical protein